MDRAGQVQLRQEAGELAARVGLTGRLGEVCSWHRWRRRVRRGWSVSGPEPGIFTDWLFACAGGLLQVRADAPGPLVVGWDQLFPGRLDRMAAARALPGALARCRGGGRAQFADLTVSLAGIGWHACGTWP
jgi:hypothetical protein